MPDIEATGPREDPDEFSLESIADEVQDLNEDVIQDQVYQDDYMGTTQIERNLSRRESHLPSSSLSRRGSHHGNMARGGTDISELSGFSAFSGASIQPLEEKQPAVRRRSTIVESLKRSDTFNKIAKFSWWDTDFKRERIKIYTIFLRNYLILSVILVIILSIYWGTYHKRESRYVNFRFLVANNDVEVDNIQPLIGDTILGVQNNTEIRKLGRWLPGNFTRDEVIDQVHDQNYWGAIYVRPNVSYEMYQAILNNDTSFNISESLVEVIYETGRDLITVQSYIVTILRDFEKAFVQGFKETYSVLINELPDESKQNVISFIPQPPDFKFYDHRPVTSSVLLAPLQLGLTYLVVFAFFQFIMTIRIQLFLASKVHGMKFILLRMGISQVSYIIISLSYVVLNTAFQLDFTATFGKSGFLVLWSIAYLTMASLGGLNENVALLCFTYFPPLVGGWLVLLMAASVAPTVSAMALTNRFFRYNYALPIHNSYALVKVVYCNTSKYQMGRNFGILVAWVVLSNLLLPFTMIHVSKVKARRELAAKEVEGAEATKK